MNWSISSTELLISLVAIALLLVLFIEWFRNFLFRKAHNKITYSPKWRSHRGTSNFSSPDYSVGADIFKWRGVLLVLSLSIICTIIGLAFFWTVPKVFIHVDCAEKEDITRFIELSPSRLFTPPPPLPSPFVWATDSIVEEEMMPEPKKPKFLLPSKSVDEKVDTIEIEHHDSLKNPPPPPPLPPPPPPAPEEITCFTARAEYYPRFPGCEDLEGSLSEKERCSTQKLLEFVYTNITYPPIARDYFIEGTVIIQFTVTKEGVVSDPKIIRDIGADCGKRALEAVRAMIEQDIRWIPGKQRGRIVPVKYYLPVRFKLE